MTDCEEIPIWINGSVHWWLSGVDKRTTCRDVLDLFEAGKADNNSGEYILVERWRRVERPLDDNAKILKVWSHWGDEQKDVRICLRKIDNEGDRDSGRGSPVAPLTSSLKRRRNRKVSWPSQPETLHPRRLAELGQLDRGIAYNSGNRQLRENCAGSHYAKTAERRRSANVCSGTGTLHSTLLERPTNSTKCCSKKSKRVRNSENIEKLMKLILAQGATIQTQLDRLRNRDQQIECIEVEKHREREEVLGRNYLLETYLDGLKEAEIPATDEEKGNDSGIHTEGGSEQMEKEKEANLDQNRPSRKRSKQTLCDSEKHRRSNSESRIHDVDSESPLKRTQSVRALNTSKRQEEQVENSSSSKEHYDVEDVVELKRVQSQVEMWEKILKINKKLEKEEENLVKLHIQIRRIQSENLKLVKSKSNPREKLLHDELETLKKELDRNSKEIYQNFTTLINKDEAVAQKQSSLVELLSELERTDREHANLIEMVQSIPDDIGISLQVKGQSVNQRNEVPNKGTTTNELSTPTPSVTDSSSTALPNTSLAIASTTPTSCQRLDEEPVKPKVLRISFDDNIQNASNNRPKESTGSTTLVKGILKNRTYDTFNVNDLEKNPAIYGTNINLKESSSKVSDKCVAGGETEVPFFNVTTTAMVHDRDSCSASDTSGLSSMYSASPVAEDSTYGTLV